MKIRQVYLSKGSCIVSLMIAVLCIAITVIAQLIPSTYTAFAFTYPIKYPWQVITYLFLHGYTEDILPADFPYAAMQVTVGHLIYNLLLVIPFGILVEKVIGRMRFLILSVSAWLVHMIFTLILFMVITPEGEANLAAGASGLAFSYMPIGMFIVFLLGKKYGFKQLFKQVSFYLLSPIAIMTLIIALSPNVKGVTGIWSMIMHILGILVGIIFSVVNRKRINDYFQRNAG
ncbi:MAG: rhomboid family intramembrane serine protease [Saccharofermentans sp.]|nr:rhomboid family intramembrane serine protease [Saccharofermentans sp.]